MKAELVTIATFYDSVTAHIVKRSLEAEGIMVFLADETVVNVAWHLSTAVGGIRLQVPSSQVKKALPVLSKFEALPDLEEEKDFVKLSWADRTVDRMFRVAVISLMLWPLVFYSVWLLIRLVVSRRRVSSNRYWKFAMTIILNTLTLCILWAVLYQKF